MIDWIPPFDVYQIFVQPWLENAEGYGLILLMGFLVISSCGLAGNYLIVRRLALMGDAISHSVLPGLAIAFLIAGRRTSVVMFLGAIAAALLTVVLVEWIHKVSRIKQDASINIVFTTLFAIGVIIISLYADTVDLDQACVLYGEIAFIPLESIIGLSGIPIGTPSTIRMGIVFLLTILFIVLTYKELLITSFDAGLANAMGIPAHAIHLLLMCLVSVIVVSAFESVGAILVVAMLILPGATAFLLTQRLWMMHLLAVVHAALSAFLGLHLAIWLDTSIAGAMVVMGSGVFLCAWLFNPKQGLLIKRFRKNRILENPTT